MNQFVPYLAVEASAGSGKTFTLAIRYISLLFLDVDPRKILALTFTNKASGEMNERIINILFDLENREIELVELVKNTGISKAKILEKKDDVLEKFLAINSKIMTIDKFFNQILRTFSLYVGLMPDFEITEEDENELFKEFLKELDEKNLLSDLVYLSVIEDMKETKITEIYRTLHDKKINSEYEKIDYSLKGYLETEIEKVLGNMKSFIENCPNNTKAMNSAFDVSSIEELASKTWLERNTLNYRTFSKCYSEELDEYFVQLKDLLNKYYKIKEAFVLEKIINLYKIYEQTAKNIKKRFGGLSFSDVTYFAKKILSSIDKDFIYFRLDSKIEHILIDEFQDTSEQQVSILAPLIEEIVSGKGVNTNIDTKSFFFVGDTKQSIYRFRGGDWRLFYQTEKKYGLENKTLKINFRSSKNVVEYNNKVFEELYPNFVPQQSRMDAKKGYVEVRINSEIEKAIVDIIKDHLNRNVKPEDIAILVYTNDDSNKVADLIKSKFPKVGVITDNSGKLINHSVNRAIIECIKYLYYKEEIYLKSFNGIIGKDPFTEILEEISQLDLKSGVSNIGKKIVETYGLFSGDSNLSKFFNLLEKFEDIHSFISSIEKESEIIDKGEADGISILTVHKSKGLEFNHVIVCDRFSSRPPVNRDSLIFDYKESGKIFYRYKGRASFDNEYKEALERQKELVEKDLINSLYVALTRAKNELYIIAKEKSSSFEILDLKEEKIGEKEIFQLEQRSEEKKKEEKLTSRSYGKQKEFLHNEMEEIEGNFHHIYFGNAVHYCLEVISDFNERSLEIGLKSTQNRYGLYVDINRVRNSVENLLKDSYFLEITKENTYKEQSVVLDGKHFVIDLLCENNGEYIVCDYKSGSKKEEHKLQVINYINAVKTLKNSENVKGVLCYIGEKKIDWVKV